MAALDSRPTSAAPDAILERGRHVKYHQRCLQSLLPTYYTSNDSNRMLLAFFVLNALDLLGSLNSTISEAERAGYVEWLYHNQLPSGGFRGFPGTNPGNEQRESKGAHWDVANVAGTFFALESLIILGDHLERVNRAGALAWLASLQRPEGSFGDILGEDSRPSGDPDLRYCYMAAAIRYMLRCPSANPPRDINVDSLVAFVLASQNYDGGFARAPLLESHAGETYCAIGTLVLLGKLTPGLSGESNIIPKSLQHLQAQTPLIRWLLLRQTASEDDVDSDDEDEEGSAETPPNVLDSDSSQLQWIGYNGRCNKPPDTCYSFWTIASLDMLGKAELVDAPGNRRFLLDKTQHQIGGFSKMEGDPPDVLHSALGLAALSLIHDSDLKPLDPVLAISKEARQRLDSARSHFER